MAERGQIGYIRFTAGERLLYIVGLRIILNLHIEDMHIEIMNIRYEIQSTLQCPIPLRFTSILSSEIISLSPNNLLPSGIPIEIYVLPLIPRSKFNAHISNS
jgi:hypothetical protein